MRTITISCRGALDLPISELHVLQKELKELSVENYEKLKKEILNTGFAFAPHAWKDPEGKWWLVDGTQRIRTLGRMAQEGFDIPPLPVVPVEAKDIKEARRRVLQGTSQYGVMTGAGLYEMLTDAELGLSDLDSFRLPDINMKAFETEFFKDPVVPGCDENEIPEPRDGRCKPGDLWQLGNHRLLCGDSTNIQHVERLLGGGKADMVFTDPPYNVNYGAKGNANPAGCTQRKDRSILNDHMEPEDFKNFCQAFTSCIVASVEGRVMFTILDQSMHCSTTIVWNKDQFVVGRGKYHNKYEPCWFGWVGSGTNFTDSRTLTNVWDVPRPHDSPLHPTMKPVELVELAINHASKPGQSVLDLFTGSGTTIIACEKTGRRGFGMELDPHYCGVIIARWEKYANQKAELLSTDVPMEVS